MSFDDAIAYRNAAARPLTDPFGRTIRYLRLSVTDRCDLRCVYCMAEDAKFEPKSAILSLEELEEIGAAFIARGVRKIRLTGGEPLVRRDVMRLVSALGRRLGDGLEELTLTTNATQLAAHAESLARAGVRRVNISLDTLDRATFARLARRDALGAVLDGIAAARDAGLAIKINTVALEGVNLDEIPAMLAWAHQGGMDLTLIEVMPMGDVDADRIDQYAPLSRVRADLARRFTLEPIEDRTGGPARYVRVRETGGRLGFITPLTGNFCDGCNRVRVTAAGALYMCLGQEDRADLRAALREGGRGALDAAIDEAMTRKPKGHDFRIETRGASPASARFMSATGG